MTEEIPSGEETTTAEVSEVLRKCTLQSALTVVKRHRYLSGQTLTDQSIAENAFLTTGSLERTAINSPNSFKISLDILCPFCCLGSSNGPLLFIHLINAYLSSMLSVFSW